MQCAIETKTPEITVCTHTHTVYVHIHTCSTITPWWLLSAGGGGGSGRLSCVTEYHWKVSHHLLSELGHQRVVSKTGAARK